jgi:hypothetical protein
MREGGGPKEGECTKEGEGFDGRELEYHHSFIRYILHNLLART